MKNEKIFIAIVVIVGAGILIAHFGLHDQIMGNVSKVQNIQNSGNAKEEEKIAPNTIEIKNYSYAPATIKVKKGTTITWVNQDLAPHTVTMDDESKEGPKSKVFGKGEKYTYTFNKTGTFPYHCEPHPYMKAVVEVTE